MNVKCRLALMFSHKTNGNSSSIFMKKTEKSLRKQNELDLCNNEDKPVFVSKVGLV